MHNPTAAIYFQRTAITGKQLSLFQTHKYVQITYTVHIAVCDL